MTLKTIKQTVTFKGATPHDAYEVLMDSKKHTAIAGTKATVSRKVGGRFSVWDGSIYGKNLELKADKKIVQSWRSDMDSWPENHFSTVTFSFSKVPDGAKLTFVQTDVPAASFKSISQGWKDYYWKPMKAFLKK